MEKNTRQDHLLRRREAIAAIGGLVAAAGIALWRLPRGGEDGGPPTTAEAASKPDCVLAPEQTEGPYYIASEPFRRDVTEGHPGVPLELDLKVVNATTCKPVRKASVEIWHADAAGDYSGFGTTRSNRTFLRGQQRTNKRGVATFNTIYPGWYQGRTVHIHVKVHVKGRTVHTGQLYFDDTVTDGVYTQSPYSSRPGRTTRNSQDGIYGSGGAQSTLRISDLGSGKRGTLTMGVRT
jgi:protocatechuate 3,4-dioxygenase beta subunit